MILSHEHTAPGIRHDHTCCTLPGLCCRIGKMPTFSQKTSKRRSKRRRKTHGFPQKTSFLFRKKKIKFSFLNKKDVFWGNRAFYDVFWNVFWTSFGKTWAICQFVSKGLAGCSKFDHVGFLEQYVRATISQRPLACARRV